MSTVTAPRDQGTNSGKTPADSRGVPPDQQYEDADVQRGTARLDATVAAWIAVLALAVGLVASPPWNGPTSELPAGVLARVESGSIERLEAGDWVEMEVGDFVYPGAELRSAEGALLEVRAGSMELAPSSRVAAERAFRLESGALLVDSGDEEQAIEIGPVVATGRGLWRVDAQAVQRIAVYEGEVRVGPPSQSGLAIDGLAQADLAGGQLPARALPLRYEPSDTWDGRLLEHVIAIDRQATGLRRSLDVRFGTEDRPPAFFADLADLDSELLAVLDVVDLSPGEGVGPAPEVFVAIAAVRAVRDATDRTALQAAEDVAELRRDGATWGIVLARHGLRADAFRDTFNETLSAGVLEPDTAPADVVETAAPPEETVDEESGPGVSGSPPVAGEPESDDSPEPTSSPEPDEGALDACEVEPCEQVSDTAEDLTDLIDDTVPGVEPRGVSGGRESPESLEETVEDTVRDIVPSVPPSTSLRDTLDMR